MFKIIGQCFSTLGAVWKKALFHMSCVTYSCCCTYTWHKMTQETQMCLCVTGSQTSRVTSSHDRSPFSEEVEMWCTVVELSRAVRRKHQFTMKVMENSDTTVLWKYKPSFSSIFHLEPCCKFELRFVSVAQPKLSTRYCPFEYICI